LYMRNSFEERIPVESMIYALNFLWLHTPMI